MKLDDVELPDGLRWSDEYDWSPVEQELSYALTGTLIMQEGATLGGRPMTLSGGENACWVTKETLDSLFALAQDAGKIMRWILNDERAFPVVWIS